MTHQLGRVLAAFFVFALSAASSAQDVYRSKTADGRTVYSDRPQAGSAVEKIVIGREPPSPTASASVAPTQGTANAEASHREPWHEPIVPGRCPPMELVDKMEASARSNVSLGYRSTITLGNGRSVTQGTPEYDRWIAEERKSAAEKCRKF